MPFTTITASSSVGASGVANLAWRNGAPTTAVIFPSTTGNSSGAFTLQYTMDDLQLSSSPRWANLSSGAIGSAGTIYSASSVSTDGAFFQFPTPVAALRISSTSGISAGPLLLKVIQGESW